MAPTAFNPADLQAAANRFRITLPCSRKSVDEAFRLRMATLAAQARIDTRIQRSLDALRKEAGNDWQILVTHGQSMPSVQTTTAPAAIVGSPTSMPPFLVGIGALAGIFITFMGLNSIFGGKPDVNSPVPAAAAAQATETPFPSSSSLIVRSYPWSECYIDGRKFGNVPSPKSFNVAAGRHTIRLEAAGHEPLQFSIQTTNGSTTMVSVNIKSGQVAMMSTRKANQ